jgi:predicted ATPase
VLVPRLPLVGRSQETVALLRAYEKAASGGYFLALEGEAGIGKTRLAEEFLGYARSGGAIAVAGRSYEGEADLVYGPFIEALRSALNHPQSAGRLAEIPAHWLAEATRLLPELAARFPGRLAAPPLEGPGAQGRFLEGLARTLLGLCAGQAARNESQGTQLAGQQVSLPGHAAGGMAGEVAQSAPNEVPLGQPSRASHLPGVLFLDDLHQADAATLNLLSYLVRRLRGHALFVLVSWRKEGLAADHPLYSLIAGVERAGAGGILPLSRLGPSHVADLVQAAAADGLALPAGLEDRLYREAEGLPFFVVEYLASLVEGVNPEAGGEWAMPHSVRDLLRARLAAADETGWQLLTSAAVIGRSFDYDTLRRSSGRGEAETVAGLEGLISLGLIQEHESRGLPVYDFSHEKLRALVYEETSLARRRLLHRRVAEALLEGARLRQETGAYANQVARHYQFAGMEAQAVEFFRQAGEYAWSLAANAEALASFQAALAASTSQDRPAGEARLRTAELYEAIGDLQMLLGSYGAAAKSLQTAAALCEPECLARIEHKLGDLYQRRGDWELSESHYQVALDALAERNPAGDLARLYADWALTVLQQEQGGRALELARRALDLAQEGGDPRALAQAHNVLGILARHAQDYPAASRHLEDSLALAEGLGDTGARVAALNNLALAYGDQGRLAEGLAAAETALRLSIQQGDRHREAALHNNLADLLHRLGQAERAMEHLKKAVVLFAEIGSDTNASSPEIWKLTEW